MRRSVSNREAELDRETRFVRDAQSPVRWEQSARRLKMAADALWSIIQNDLDRFDAEIVLISLGPIWLLVAGLAIENLIKAILVRQKKLILCDRQLPDWFCTHKTSALCERAALRITPSQRRFVKRLEEFVMWAGKYPVSRRAPEMELSRSFVGYEAADFADLYSRLQAIARSTPRRS